MRAEEEGQALLHVAERLRARFPEVDSTTINQLVERFHRAYDGRPIREFIPIMVEREARDHLLHLPRQRGPADAVDAVDPVGMVDGRPETLTQ